jgi:hypothetical protein
MAERHVRLAQRVVVRQEALIQRLRIADADPSEAERTLVIFKSNLKIFESHRDALLRSAHGGRSRR